ncbi:MAG: LysM peptidoglycan-binding domain-containing protein [Xanthomonadaceae bacterium]|nr:LysM peptidoglycan-binding domain-containing protein [Xanthomonadaceae bacterium]
MTSGHHMKDCGRRLGQALRLAPLLAVLGVAGCAQFNALKAKVGASRPSVVVTPPATAPAGTATTQEPSFTSIVDELQLGHYAEGESALRQYLKQHPGDRPAQAMLRQLTADPRQMLGAPSGTYVVQAGDSYSSLAARYLGDPGLFLILARYNGSTNPSVLRLGETVRLPLSAKRLSLAPGTAASAAVPVAAPVAESAAVKARRLQKESLTLLGQGHKNQALARLDQALQVDPQLEPAGTGAAALRRQLLATYHQRAIVLYRDQHLDQAIALWDRVLAIDPHYEPAVIYRARALDLKARLKQF